MQEQLLINVIEENLKQQSVTPADRQKEKADFDNALFVKAPRMKMVRNKKTHQIHLDRPSMTAPEKVRAVLRSVFKHLIDDGREHAYIVTLDANNRFINTWDVSAGGLDHVNIDKAILFTRVLATDNATSWILAHNHTSGDPAPSDDDLNYVDVFKRGGLYLNRPMRDFLIFGDGNESYYSHRENNYDL